MECIFSKGFDIIKTEILDNSSKIMHLIKLEDKLIFIDGIHYVIDGYDYLYVTDIHPAVRKQLEWVKGVNFAKNYIFETGKYEYIIRIDDSDKFKLSEPLCLEIDYEMNGVTTKRKVFHSGYYQCGKTLGISFNSSGSIIGFLPDTYMDMLEGKEIYEEYTKGRWNKKYGSKTYRIVGEEWIKTFIKEQNHEKDNKDAH